MFREARAGGYLLPALNSARTPKCKHCLGNDSSARPQTGRIFDPRRMFDPRKTEKNRFSLNKYDCLAKTSIFEVPRSRRIDPCQHFQIRSYSDPFRAKSSFLGRAGPGQASRSTEKTLKNQPLGPCPCEREPHFELERLNKSSVRPNGTPVMSISRLPRF